MLFLKQCFVMFFGFSSGAVVSAGVFAFITVIGVVPGIAHKTKTEAHVRLFEEVIIFGGMTGIFLMIFKVVIPIGLIGAMATSFLSGVFFGCLAMSLAEVLDVVPVFMRRLKLKSGLGMFIMSFAVGKLIGSVLYFCVPGFFRPPN